MRWLLALSVAMGLMGAAEARPQSLREDPKLEQGLFAISVANKIRRECETISARFLTAQRTMWKLHAHARSLGFSDAEIDAYVNDEAEKNRMRERRDSYLANLGVVETAPETYCAAGRTEIEKASQIGALLRLDERG